MNPGTVWTLLSIVTILGIRFKRKIQSEDGDIVGLVNGPISIPSAQLLVNGSIGAVATFEGTTRNYFEGKAVVELEYEAYEALALNVLRQIIQRAKDRHKGLLRVVIFHRLGPCPVGETSLYIATLSSHRSPALSALPYLVDEIKAQVPIWKLEKYEHDVSAAKWKENVEWKPPTQ